jgi:hypothetical protein
LDWEICRVFHVGFISNGSIVECAEYTLRAARLEGYL